MKPREYCAPQFHGVFAHYGELGLRRLTTTGAALLLRYRPQLFGLVGERRR